MLAQLSVEALFVLACLGVTLDLLFGEPRRGHPLVAFGRLAERLERYLNSAALRTALAGRLRGTAAVAIATGIPVTVIARLIVEAPHWAAAVIQATALYFALGTKSLRLHAQAVAGALEASDLGRARRCCALLVTRDLAAADAPEVARAAVESTLENGNDAVCGALFWFLIGGAPGTLAYRLVNTLDAMWGYKTARYKHFGWAAARLDDVMNYLPARLTALTYALLGDTRTGVHCWRTQAHAWESPNAGPVMATGAGALGITLGGAARYHGRMERRAILGRGLEPKAADIGRALRLVHAGLAMWLVGLAFAAFIAGRGRYA